MLAQIDWWQHIDGYCERTDPSFWSEPLNAWSNAAFWVSAALFAIFLVAAGKPSPHSPEALIVGRSDRRGLWVLNALLVGIGAGSFCFHTFAVRWAALLDVLFIVLWVYAYLWISAKRVLRWHAAVCVIALIGHLMFSIALTAITQWFLMAYLPTAVAAYLLALHASRLPLPGRRWLWASAVVFTISMCMAGLDAPLCERVPTGTHFLWHIFNAAALLLGSIGLALNLAATRADPPIHNNAARV